MSLAELMTACRRFIQTRDNLRSPCPLVRRARLLRIPGAIRGVSLRFLPGGRFIITCHHDGFVRLWDIDPGTRESRPGCNCPASEELTGSGSCATPLAVYEVVFTPTLVRVRPSGDSGEDVICVLVSMHR